MELSPRLRTVADMVTKGASVADVGTDHGYLPIWLIKNGICPKAIATDLRAQPLQSGINNAKSSGVADLIDFRLCNGLELVRSDEVEEITICGMGGDTMAEIIDASPWSKSKPMVLQPSRSADDLRKYLARTGLIIECERLVMDAGLMYSVFRVIPGAPYSITPAESYASRALLNSDDPLLHDYLKRMESVLSKAVKGTEVSSKPHDVQRHEFFASALNEIKQMIGD